LQEQKTTHTLIRASTAFALRAPDWHAWVNDKIAGG